MVDKEINVCVKCENYIEKFKRAHLQYSMHQCKTIVKGSLDYVKGIKTQDKTLIMPCYSKNKNGDCVDYKRIIDGQ